jgi:hypothetical protein
LSALRRVVTCGRGHRSGSVVRWKRRLAFHAPAAKWPYRPAQCFISTFEPFLLDLVMSLVSIFLTISLRNSTVLFLLLCEIQQSQGVISLFSSQLVVTPVPFCGLGQRLRAGNGGIARGRSAVPHHDFGREQGFMQ